MPQSLVLVFLGGGIGSTGRYLISLLAASLFGDAFAWGTLAVNLGGCFVIGLLAGLADRSLISREFRIFFVSGLLGGLTTFSSFSLETVRLMGTGLLGKAGLNIAANALLGLGLTALGLAAAARV
ncbi:MAG TPA: fluoride efflux transporter CrcB [Rectinemataceae bacterium]|nr:fluoride efflux transporter CrcB [Rectinemataceae bacterium]